MGRPRRCAAFQKVVPEGRIELPTNPDYVGAALPGSEKLDYFGRILPQLESALGARCFSPGSKCLERDKFDRSAEPPGCVGVTGSVLGNPVVEVVCEADVMASVGSLQNVNE